MHETLRDLLGILFLPTACCTSIYFNIRTVYRCMYVVICTCMHIIYLIISIYIIIDKDDKETHRYIYIYIL